MATHHTTVPHSLERLNTTASGERRAGVYLQAWTDTTPGRVSEMDFGLAALHALVGVTMGQSRGMLLSHSLAAGDLSIACRGVKCTSETRPTSVLERLFVGNGTLK